MSVDACFPANINGLLSANPHLGLVLSNGLLGRDETLSGPLQCIGKHTAINDAVVNTLTAI